MIWRKEMRTGIKREYCRLEGGDGVLKIVFLKGGSSY